MKLHYFLAIIAFSWMFSQASLASGHEHDRLEQSVFRNTIQVDDIKSQATLVRQTSWQTFKQKYGNWHGTFNVLTKQPLRAMGQPIKLMTGNLENAANSFLNNELSVFNYPLEDLHLTKINQSKKYQFVRFEQKHKGLAVLNSQLTLVVNQRNEVAAFMADVFGDIEVVTTPTLTTNKAIDYAKNGLNSSFESVATPTLKVLPIPTEEGYNFALIYELLIKGKNAHGIPAHYLTYVDAHSGAILYRYNKVHTVEEQADEFTITSEVSSNARQETTLEALPHVNVEVAGQTITTDENGNLDFVADVTQPANLILEGQFCDVRIGETGNNTPNFNFVLNPSFAEASLNLSDDIDLAAVSAYYHVNRIHDYMKLWLPAGFTNMDDPMITRIERQDGSCNAYYDGTLNFFAQLDGCFSLALFGDVVYHEYGHGINNDFYQYLGVGFNNGALNEAYADIWSLSLTENPILAQGYTQTNPFGSIRRYDINPKVYPQDLIGQVHADGEIIAGAWWDLGEEIGLENMFEIFTESQISAVMRPNGQEGALYGDVLFQAILADDDNGDVSDGTPNLETIIKEFADHGILLAINASVNHEEIGGIAENLVTQIDFELAVDLDYQAFISEVVLKYRTSPTAAYESVATVGIGNDDYFALLPEQPKGTVIDYYFEVSSSLAIPAVSPVLADQENGNLTHKLLVGYEPVLTDDFSNSSFLWTIGTAADDAETGIWEIASPFASSIQGEMVQTGLDHSESNDNFCAFTGNDPEGNGGTNDVDGGTTTLTSAPYNLTQFEDPVISYYRWYTNDQGQNPGADVWEVFLSGDGVNWIPIEETQVADHSWRRNAFRVLDYLEEITPFTQIRFAASDRATNGALVEAAVDDIVIYDLAEEPILGINDLGYTIKIYPNPANEQLFVNCGCTGTIEVFNTLGQVVKNAAINGAIRLNTSDLATGLYILKLQTLEGVAEQKIIIER